MFYTNVKQESQEYNNTLYSGRNETAGEPLSDETLYRAV